VKDCGKTFHQLLEHIYQFHLAEKTMLCPHCDYGSTYRPQLVTVHIRRNHANMPETVIDRRSDFSDEADKWRPLCCPLIDSDDGDETPTKSTSPFADSEGPRSPEVIKDKNFCIGCKKISEKKPLWSTR